MFRSNILCFSQHVGAIATARVITCKLRRRYLRISSSSMERPLLLHCWLPPIDLSIMTSIKGDTHLSLALSRGTSLCYTMASFKHQTFLHFASKSTVHVSVNKRIGTTGHKNKENC